MRMQVHLEGDNAWPDLAKKHPPVQGVEIVAVACLPAGMTSGEPSVMFRCHGEKGKVVLAQTSVKMLLVAAEAIKQKYGAEIKSEAFYVLDPKTAAEMEAAGEFKPLKCSVCGRTAIVKDTDSISPDFDQAQEDALRWNKTGKCPGCEAASN